MLRSKKYATLLAPLSYLYGLGVRLRNFLFDRGFLPSVSYPIPIICVGNITVGGTGKTPHVEYILGVLSGEMRVAVVSRGYKRKTKGLVWADAQSTAEDIGDEPMQIHRKYPEVRIVVDGNRRRAIEALMGLPEGERPELILMDDGMQHRYVRPSFTILLVDFHRLPQKDHLLPLGELREPASAIDRADCVILTKCPEHMTPISARLALINLNLYPYQQVFFSSVRYSPPRQVLGLMKGIAPNEQIPTEHQPIRKGPTIPQGALVLAMAGIAQPERFYQELRRSYRVLGEVSYPDHHHFVPGDIAELRERYNALRRQHPEQSLYIISTEKDAIRLIGLWEGFDEEFLTHLYYLPIQIDFLEDREGFDEMLRQSAQKAQDQY